MRTVRSRHQRAVLAARQAVPDPARVFVAGNANAVVERGAAEPAVQHIFVRQLTAIPALLLLEQQVKHRIREARTNADDRASHAKTRPLSKTKCHQRQCAAPTIRSALRWS